MSTIPPIYIGSEPKAEISGSVTSMSVSLTLDEVSQISIDIYDPNLDMLRANYFQIRQPVSYLGMTFEISAIEVSQDVKQKISLALRPQATQILKRTKQASISTGGGLDFVANKAREVGLALFMEYSSPKASTASAKEPAAIAPDVTTNVSQNSFLPIQQSAWDVIKKIATDFTYIVCEMDNRLIFASEPFLLGKFGITGYGENPGFISTPVIWNSEPRANRLVQNYEPIIGPPERPILGLGSSGRSVEYLQSVLSKRAGQTITDEYGYFGQSTLAAVHNLQIFTNLGASATVNNMSWNIVDYLALGVSTIGPAANFQYITPLGVPTLRKSDDAYEAATCSFAVEREQGKLLRPGMTIRIDGVPFFEGHYLVISVSWNEGTTEAIAVQARTLVEPKPSSDEKNDDLSRFRNALSWTGGGLANDVIGTPAWSVSR